MTVCGQPYLNLGAKSWLAALARFDNALGSNDFWNAEAMGRCASSGESVSIRTRWDGVGRVRLDTGPVDQVRSMPGWTLCPGQLRSMPRRRMILSRLAWSARPSVSAVRVT